MKYKTTRKAIIDGTPSAFLYSAPYCAIQYLTASEAPRAYTCGVYGWNFDVYEIEGLTICTGYRGMPGETVPEWVIEADKECARLDWKEREAFARGVFQRLRDEAGNKAMEAFKARTAARGVN